MSRLFVGGFLSAMVLVLGYQGFSGQRNVLVTETYSENLADSQPDLAESAVASCCQESATELVTEEPRPLLVDPVAVEPVSVEFADTADESGTAFPTPIVQAGGTEANPFVSEKNPFSLPQKNRSAKKTEPVLNFEPPAFDDGSSGATTAGDAATDEEAAPAMDRIWIMIHPDQGVGLQFLQTAEQVLLKKGQGAGTQEFFLIDCEKFSMEGKLGEGKPEFLLTCEAFSLEGAFRTAKALEIKGTKLIYDTGRQELTLSGTEEAPVRVSIRDNDESKLQAQEIILKLNESSYQMQVTGANMELITVPAKLQPTPEKQSDAPLFGSF